MSNIIATKDTGRRRRLAGTDFPITHHVCRDETCGTVTWNLVTGLCNGIPEDTIEFETQKAALDALAALPGVAEEEPDTELDKQIVMFTTIDDAHGFVQNSGVLDWRWAGKASADGFAGYLWRHYNQIDADAYDAELRAYLESVGENPSDYIQPVNRPHKENP